MTEITVQEMKEDMERAIKKYGPNARISIRDSGTGLWRPLFAEELGIKPGRRNAPEAE